MLHMCWRSVSASLHRCSSIFVAQCMQQPRMLIPSSVSGYPYKLVWLLKQRACRNRPAPHLFIQLQSCFVENRVKLHRYNLLTYNLLTYL